MVVVDELSSFKNHQSKRFKALMKVRPKVQRIVGLTGTLSSNGLMDLFAEYKLLDKGERLGRFIGQYREKYFKPDKANGPIVYSYKILSGAEEAIYARISDITISMKSADHLEMPELVNSRYTVQLDKKELARLWRQGQKNTVSVIYIMAANTIDVQIMNALETKDHTQSALIDAVKAEVDSLERFFKSQWYSVLTSVEGEVLIWKLREEYNL